LITVAITILVLVIHFNRNRINLSLPVQCIGKLEQYAVIVKPDREANFVGSANIATPEAISYGIAMIS
jgi:hypothetical protein